VNHPLITCLCLTRNRREWIPKAIANFLAQTYPNKELLILSDGEPVHDLIPRDERIRHIPIEKSFCIGKKRNFGIPQAQGEIIAHWDDDDWSAPERLSRQVSHLLETGKAVAGYHAMYFTDGSAWWKFVHSAHFGIGTSLMYRKSWWAAHPFPAVQYNEDGAFSKEADRYGELVSCEAGLLMVASIHSGNTTRRGGNLDSAAYRPMPRPQGIGSPFA
jgi:glycosyltransferase involved in cell wall biosynthesis